MRNFFKKSKGGPKYKVQEVGGGTVTLCPTCKKLLWNAEQFPALSGLYLSNLQKHLHLGHGNIHAYIVED